MLHICGWSMEKGQFDKKAVERLNRMTWLYERLPEKENKIVSLSNTEFTMYQVGTYKNNSWALVSEFAKSGVIFDFDASSAQAEAAKNWKNMYRITTSKECPERPTQTEKLCTEIWKKECIFLSRHKKHKLAMP